MEAHAYQMTMAAVGLTAGAYFYLLRADRKTAGSERIIIVR
jgi:hypothetical protein